MDMVRMGRLSKEHLALKQDPPFSCRVVEVSEDLNQWQATIMGPADSPYAGGLFHVNIDIPPDYPFNPPKVAFKEKVYHPNIAYRLICLDILKEKWSPVLNISKVLSSIYSLLKNPDPENPCVPEFAEVYMKDRTSFDAVARCWTQKYAMG